MIETAAPVTLQLAMLIGGLSLASGIGGWRHPEIWPEMFEELERSPGLAFAVGLIGALLGALILVLPGGWTDPLAFAVSLVGLLELAGGLVMLALPQAYVRLVRPLVAGRTRLWAGFAILLGLAFLLAGLLGRAAT